MQKPRISHLTMILAIGVLLFAGVAGFRSGDFRVDSVLASGVDADGTTSTVTLTETSFDCTFVNRDSTATNTSDLTINGGSALLRLYGGDVYNTDDGQVPIAITSFKFDAVVGTPDVQYYCFGR